MAISRNCHYALMELARENLLKAEWFACVGDVQCTSFLRFLAAASTNWTTRFPVGARSFVMSVSISIGMSLCEHIMKVKVKR